MVGAKLADTRDAVAEFSADIAEFTDRLNDAKRRRHDERSRWRSQRVQALQETTQHRTGAGVLWKPKITSIESTVMPNERDQTVHGLHGVQCLA